MDGCEFLPFGIHIGGVVFKRVVHKGSLGKSKLLHELAHLVVGEYLLHLRVGQMFGVVL